MKEKEIKKRNKKRDGGDIKRREGEFRLCRTTKWRRPRPSLAEPRACAARRQDGGGRGPGAAAGGGGGPAGSGAAAVGPGCPPSPALQLRGTPQALGAPVPLQGEALGVPGERRVPGGVRGQTRLVRLPAQLQGRCPAPAYPQGLSAQGEASGEPLPHLPGPPPLRGFSEREAPGPVRLPPLGLHLPPHPHRGLHEAAQAPAEGHHQSPRPRADVAARPLRAGASGRLRRPPPGRGEDATGPTAGGRPRLVPVVRLAAAPPSLHRSPQAPLQGLPPAGGGQPGPGRSPQGSGRSPRGSVRGWREE